ncbi:MAG: hypothetical protein RL670_241 [Actinomycetota bacterium]
MNLIVAAVLLWGFCLGLIGFSWWPLVGAGLVVAASAIALRIPLTRLQNALVIFGMFAAIASTTNRLALFSDQAFGFAWVGALRQALLANSMAVSAESSALVFGLTLGDDSALPLGLREAMQTVSLTHLTAVSGTNCAIVVAASYFLLSRFSLRVRVLSSAGVLIAYVCLVGPQTSVLRAAMMATVVLLSKMLGRAIHPAYALASAVIFWLALTPSVAVSLSFQLSVAATLGLLWLTPEIYGRLSHWPKWIAMPVSASLAAQLFCTPLLLNLQGGLPTFAIPANLLADVLIAPITILGLLAVVTTSVPIICGALFWLASLVAEPIVLIAKYFANLPFATMPWSLDAFGVGAALLLAIFAVLWFSSARLWLRNLAALGAIALCIASAGNVANRMVQYLQWPGPDWQVVSCDVGQGDATVVRSGGDVALIDTGRKEVSIDGCLSRLGVDRISLLVLTHFDQDHVAGLAGALANRQIDLAMVTAYADDRPGADWARGQLERSHIPIVIAERGMAGTLGDSKWQVLNPEHDGAEAEDSNDGSIVMTFALAGFDLIAMADLGEKGQMRLAQKVPSSGIFRARPVVLKVAHHGSADQYAELIEALHPAVSLLSVGQDNGYGHPTARTLQLLERTGSIIARTDLLGSLAIGRSVERIAVSRDD